MGQDAWLELRVRSTTRNAPVPYTHAQFLQPNFYAMKLLLSACSLLVCATAQGGPHEPLNNPCLNASSPQSKQPWCDPKVGVDARVADMVSRMTLVEKISNLNTNGTKIDSLGLNRCAAHHASCPHENTRN